MPVFVGIVAGLLSSALGRFGRLDRDRAFYPVVLIVVAQYYILFAAIGGAGAMPMELIAATVFIAVAILGFRISLWWVAAALAGHGLFDMVHHRVIANPGVPEWWPAFCASADVALAGVLALLLLRRAIPARD